MRNFNHFGSHEEVVYTPHHAWVCGYGDAVKSCVSAFHGSSSQMVTSSLSAPNAFVVLKCCSRPPRRKHHRCCRQTLPKPGSVVPGMCFRITMRTRLCFETPLKNIGHSLSPEKQVRNGLATEVRESPKTQDKAERLMVTFVVAFLHEPGAGAA